MNKNSERLGRQIEEKLEAVNQIKKHLNGFFLEARTELTNAGMSRGWKNLKPETATKQQKALTTYESWVNSTRPLVVEFLPERLDEFDKMRDEFVDIVTLQIAAPDHPARSMNRAAQLISQQKGIVQSIPDKVEIELLASRKSISRDIAKSEVLRGEQLLEEGDIRPAGVIAGVALERHLITLCSSAEQDVEYDRMDGISSLAKSLSQAGVISDDDMRLLDWMGGVRNKCSHASDEEPKRTEVKRMIREADEFIYETRI
ncbi:hypothetical protein [Haloferax volcanii]|uniref:DUF4145 domain-containing protein n=1 Tax=Haloferax volcanii TaxID=2246 RepID=A0A558FTE5_HALVO|nr:hypothetical protein [Haloferax volcanii]TVT88749.1 hypothetical protein FQA18_18840 [Haloferax volcanii]